MAIVIPVILAFIVTCFGWIKYRPWTDPDVNNKVKFFFLLWYAWTINLSWVGIFAYMLMRIQVQIDNVKRQRTLQQGE